MTTISTDYKTTLLRKEHVKPVIQLFVKTFCEDEPITKHLGITFDEYKPFAEAVVNKALKDGLSVVALDEDNRVVACTIAEDMANPFTPTLSAFPKMEPILGLLDELSKPFIQDKVFNKSKIAHVWIALVEKKHRGKGLSTQIDMACADVLVRKGFDFVYAEFTNDLSENITHHYKVIQLCNRVDYADFTFQGKKPFAGVKGGTAAYLIGIRPGIQLDSLAKCYTMQGKY